MSNAEASSVPALIEPRALLRIEALPSERHPAAVYLSGLGSGSRRTMRQSLGVIASLISGGRADIRSLAWEKLRYQHCQAIRTALTEKYSLRASRLAFTSSTGVRFNQYIGANHATASLHPAFSRCSLPTSIGAGPSFSPTPA